MEGLIMKYFVLKPSGKSKYAEASRKAMRAYAHHIYTENGKLATSLLNWVDKESFVSKEDIATVKDAELLKD